MKNVLVPTLLVVITLMAYNQATSQQAASSRAQSRAESMDKSAAATYEHLATAIIAIEQTEDELVKSILLGYHAAAQGHLKAAVADEANRREHLEAAATEVSNIANEGDKRIQAVRQRLAKAGHTHNTDVVTKEDFMFVNSKEKKDLLALAKRVGQMGDGAKTADVKAAQEELATVFDKAVAPE
ncbi:MAG: hypothetical protein P4L84_01320 [Isosphaeraceae bacterium]|nr:hypothetical protein [Isosphaeraceae bacterium]